MAVPKTQTQDNFDPGGFITSWTANDYHPHSRGVVWYTAFVLIFTSVSVWSVISDPKWGWLTALSFILVAGMYSFFHKDGHETHDVSFFEYGMFIDQQFVSWEEITGYWFVYDETVSVVNLEQKKGKNGRTITLQMGNQTPDFFRSALGKLNVPEVEDKQESLVELWIRALKL